MSCQIAIFDNLIFSFTYLVRFHSQERDSVLDDGKRLRDLIEIHDSVFFSDIRESRWLPKLLCANTNKV